MAMHDSWTNAQTAVLGSMLISPQCVPMVMAELREEDFGSAYQTIYRAIRQLWRENQPVDPVTVAHLLGDAYARTLMELIEITPTAAHIRSYIPICRNEARLAQLKTLAIQLADADTYEDARDLVSSAAALIGDHRSDDRVYPMEQLMQLFYARHLSGVQPEYLPWPLPGLGKQLYTERGDFVVLGGYPSAGKTALSLQIADHWAANGYKVGYYSLETGPVKWVDRYVAAKQRISLQDIKHNTIPDHQAEDLAPASMEIIKTPIEVIQASGMTVDDIQATALSRRQEIVVIDYLQLIRSKGYNRTEEVTQISMALHTMSQRYGITVLALSQLGRQDKSRQRRAPGMSDLRESGQIEQDADAILLLYLEDEEAPQGDRILKVAKNKEGIRGRMLLGFDGAHQIFFRRKRDDQDPPEGFVDPWPEQQSMQD